MNDPGGPVFDITLKLLVLGVPLAVLVAAIVVFALIIRAANRRNRDNRDERRKI